MIYKGKQIDDRIYVSREEKLSELCSNCEEFDVSEIDRWMKAVIQKSKELKQKGVAFKDVQLQISADGWHYNPNGADDESYMNISITWMEMETDTERESRIEKKKKWIDQEIETEKRAAEAKDAAQKREIENAIRTLENSGYKVTGKK